MQTNARRWWESAGLDSSREIMLPLISVDDVVQLKKNKILVDIRPFTTHQYSVFGIEDSEENRHANFLDCHVKNSYYMTDTVTLQGLQAKAGLSQGQQAAFERDMEHLHKVAQIQMDFLVAYRENYPSHFIVIIGNKFSTGADFGKFLCERHISKVCILKGGIDSFREDHPSLLRKARNTQ